MTNWRKLSKESRNILRHERKYNFGICPIHGLDCPRECVNNFVIPKNPDDEQRHEATLKRKALEERSAHSTILQNYEYSSEE